MLSNLVCSLFEHEQVITTGPRAKEARSLAEKMVTLAKRGTLHARRQAIAKLKRKDVVAKLFEDIGQRNPERQGGYTRILKMDSHRLGDSAEKVVFALVDAKVEAPVEAAEESNSDS
jgi:large subunit ribosomal protein L17